MYNSPIHLCPACKRYVALDQSKQECARQQKCTVDPCPLAHLFAASADSSDKPTSEDPDALKAKLSVP
jgi:hypothetical protein